jgi:lipoprotein-releasing system permease protein
MSYSFFALCFFFARRYALSPHSLGFIRIITIASMIGIALGVCALVIVMSLFNGFRSLAYKQLQEYDPHLRIRAEQGVWLHNQDSLIQAIRRIDAVRSIVPIIQGKIILRHGTMFAPAQMFAGDMDSVLAITNIRHAGVIQSITDEGRTPTTLPQCYLSIGLADKLLARAGDTIFLLAPQSLERVFTIGGVPQLYPVMIAKIFQTGNKEYDAVRVVVPQSIGSLVLSAPLHSATMIDIQCESVDQTSMVQAQLASVFSSSAQPYIRIETWYDLHREFYDIMKFERIASFIIIALIVVVAVFNVFASLAMAVTEKTSNIGLLRALGATQNIIIGIFFAESVVIGCIGICTGLVLGIGGVLAQQKFGIIQLDPTQYIVPSLPMELHGFDVGVVVAVALALSMLAGILPARNAGRIIPINALHDRES